MAAFNAPPTGDMAHNPGMCPDWELNLQPFGSQAGAQSTEPHQPGLLFIFFIFFLFLKPFSISCNTGLVMMNSFSFFLSGELFFHFIVCMHCNDIDDMDWGHIMGHLSTLIFILYHLSQYHAENNTFNKHLLVHCLVFLISF